MIEKRSIRKSTWYDWLIDYIPKSPKYGGSC